jgi:predicted branched-subunit amino acid permease
MAVPAAAISPTGVAPATSARAGLRAIAPITPAGFAFGASFGLVAHSSGIPALPAIVMSLTAFAGSAQFAVASGMHTGSGLAAGLVAAILLNLRYLPIGLSVASAVPGRWWQRLVGAQLVVDESWAIGAIAPGRWAPRRLLGAGLGLYVAWNAGTILGSVGGSILGDPSRLGLDAAFPALFLALVVGMLRTGAGSADHVRRARLAAVLGAAIALVTIPIAPPGVPLICAAAACVVGYLPDRSEGS